MPAIQDTLPIPLSELEPGAKGRVARLKATGPARRRLQDMGLVPGVEVAVVRLAPLGDPVEIMVRGYHLSLRRDEARDILIEVF